MIKTALRLVLLISFLFPIVYGLQAEPPRTHLKVGDVAPDFTLTDNSGKPVKLSDFRNRKNVVLAFYVLAFTGG